MLHIYIRRLVIALSFLFILGAVLFAILQA